MDHIPFTLPNGITGHLSPLDKTEPAKWFHVMVGNRYHGQLMLNPGKGWWLPDSSLSEYADQLGAIIEAWYE
jgi:hypothetical protein